MARSPRTLRRRAVASAVAGALVLAACGGGDDDASSGAPAGTEAPAPSGSESESATNQLPDVVVDDLQTGDKVNLRDFAPSETPLLLWMWAPH